MSDNYHLKRDYRAAARLYFQNALNEHNMKYSIHPVVELTPTSHIADVGTGTGAWLLDRSREMPKSVVLHGYDISLRQCPHPNWCPENVKMYQWDLNAPVPPMAQGQYDFVHARAILQAVRNQDPGPVVEQLKRITKPGGWIQWIDMDVYKLEVLKASPEIECKSTEELLELYRKTFLPFVGKAPGWPSQLPRTFEKHGLKDVKVDEFEFRREDYPTFHDNMLLGAEELGNFAADKEAFQKVLDDAVAEYEASKRGIAIVCPGLLVVGRV